MRFTRGVSGSWTADDAGACCSDWLVEDRAEARPRKVRVSRTLLGLELADSAPRVLSLMMRDRRLGVPVLSLLMVLLLLYFPLPRGVRPV